MGVLPFGCIFIQLFFVLNSIWSSQIYYMYGFLFLVFVILIITCSETTILLCYFHLCAEDYHWWWRSFLTSGFTSFYLCVYCVHYFMTKLEIEGAASPFSSSQVQLDSSPAFGLCEKFTVWSKLTKRRFFLIGCMTIEAVILHQSSRRKKKCT